MALLVKIGADIKSFDKAIIAPASKNITATINRATCLVK